MSGNPLLNDSMNQSDDHPNDQAITIDDGNEILLEQDNHQEEEQYLDEIIVEQRVNQGVSKLIPFEDEPEQNSPIKLLNKETV